MTFLDHTKVNLKHKPSLIRARIHGLISDKEMCLDVSKKFEGQFADKKNKIYNIKISINLFAHQRKLHMPNLELIVPRQSKQSSQKKQCNVNGTLVI